MGTLEDRARRATEAKDIEDLIKVGVYGNAHHDMVLFKTADRLMIRPGISRSEQRAILEFIGEVVMGLDHEDYTDAQIDQYITDMQ